MAENDYYAGYAAAIEKFSDDFERVRREKDWDDNLYQKDVVNEAIDILDCLRVRLCIEFGRDNRHIS